MEKRKRRFGDRYDGRLIRSIDPFYRIIPYIMKTRSDAQNFFEDRIEIGHTEAFIKEMRKNNENEGIGFLHVVIAAMVRTISQKPALNRFIAGRRIYARNEILISLALKKGLSDESRETTIKVSFKPEDTLMDVVRKFNEAIIQNKKIEEKNKTDKTAKLVMMCPGFIVRFIVWLMSFLDNFGLMPKIINEVSPFHTSIFITDLGSLGIQPIYHHLYNFGTTSIFVAFGAKHRQTVINKYNHTVTKKYVDFKVVTDERIADGFYFASAFKMFRSLLQNPGRLMEPPEKCYEDID
jgi:hypothetical protein